MVAWPPQVIRLTLGALGVLAEVDRGDHGRADRGRGEVDRLDAELGVLRRVLPVHVGGGGLEDQVGALVGEQPVHALGGGGQAVVRRPLQPGALRVDADHPARLDDVGAEQLVHEVGADVARPDDRGGGLGHGVFPVARSRLVELGGHGAEPGELGAEAGARAGVDRPGAGPGDDEVPGLELHPEAGHLAGQPGDAPGRVAEHRTGVAAGDLAVARSRSTAPRRCSPGRRLAPPARRGSGGPRRG